MQSGHTLGCVQHIHWYLRIPREWSVQSKQLRRNRFSAILADHRKDSVGDARGRKAYVHKTGCGSCEKVEELRCLVLPREAPSRSNPATHASEVVPTQSELHIEAESAIMQRVNLPSV
jgi:hypothetical protein